MHDLLLHVAGTVPDGSEGGEDPPAADDPGLEERPQRRGDLALKNSLTVCIYFRGLGMFANL